MIRTRLALGSLALVLLLGACGGSGRTTGPSTKAQAFGPETRLVDLEHPGRSAALFSLFNADQGVPRLVLLVSPTCPTCLVGASWVLQHILERYRDAKLRVYAIWMPVFAGDRRGAWDDKVLDDPRVTQLWDGGQLFGSWLQAHGGAFWDTFLFYGPEARWRDKPTRPLATGTPIIGATGELGKAAASLLAS